ncbi:MAG: ATP-binding cassette domain-containing protein [Mycetocola sp.]
MTAIFECEDLMVGYGKVSVARDISLALEPREILAVLGPNGAGKTSLVMTMAGLLAPMSGTIRLRGETVKGGSARRLNRDGVVLVPDSRALFKAMSTRENIQIASKARGMSVDDAFAMFPALAKREKVRAGMLSGGEQQMLAVARALVQGPTVLIVDEMSMGLAPLIVEQLMPTLREVADSTDAAVVLVEQHVQLALEIADQALVLVHGEVSLHDRAEVIRSDPHRLEVAYLGADGTATAAP